MHNHYSDYFEQGQQKINFNLLEIRIPDNDPVHTLKKILEELNFSRLSSRYSKIGRKGYNPIMIFAVLLYANMRGVRAIDRIVELLNRDIAFISLAKGEKPQRDVFYDFVNEKMSTEILEDLHYQFIKKLHKENLISLEALYIDGTKIEANANRYTFVWRGSINYRLANLLDRIESLYRSYNDLIHEHGYNRKYKLADAEMYIIEGIDKVREVIEKNRANKKVNKKKKSNNTIIEIDNISPLKMLELQTKITEIAVGEKILFVAGKGQKKHPLQKLHEELCELGERLLKYKESFEIMGPNRNSYSKTDVEATFMRMKDDHMRNGQLKPAYNIQIAVENYFIIHGYISSDRTDYNPLIPVLKKHKNALDKYPEELTADSGYCSEKNLLFLRENEIISYIKLQTHEKSKTRAYQNDISKHYNMEKVEHEEENYYVCHEGRKLHLERIETSNVKGFERKFSVYQSDNCDDCKSKSECLYKYDENKHEKKNKQMKVNQRWESLKEESNENIQSDRGILNRQIRSIQTEGFFGDMKANNGFDRFYHRSEEKVFKELLLYIMGKNIDKYHKFINQKIKKFEGKKEQIIA